MMDLNTGILLAILFVVCGIAAIHIIKLRKQCFNDKEKK